MPHADLVSTIPYVSSIDQILRAKKRWGVAAVALAYRLNKLGLMTEWQYIQVNRRYRTSEPDGRSEEHTSELQSLMSISYAVFCLKKKKQYKTTHTEHQYIHTDIY